MTEDQIDRKIAVIFATDVVGYSKSMEVDEAQTIKNLRACRRLLDASLKQYDGRIFNTAGDSVLAEFSSAVSAVECAADFQRNVRQRNQSSDKAEVMEFRIGINMGDVVIEGEDLYGDGVNIAARLEALAQPNGISVSKPVYEFAQAKMELPFNDLGVQQVKENRFHVYDVLLDPSQKRSLSKPLSFRLPMLAATTAVFALIGAGLLYQFGAGKVSEGASDFAYELPTKPSIAVMPFTNLSGDESKEYVSSGVTQNITNSLSKSPELFIISYSSAKQIFSKTSDVIKISEALGVQYLLTGSIQQSGQSLRVNVEFVDAISGQNVWVDQLDGEIGNLFLFQDQITQKILENFQINMTASLLGKSASTNFSSVEQMRQIILFREHYLAFSQNGYSAAKKIADELYKRDPDSGPSNLAKGWVEFQALIMGLTEDREQSLKLGRVFSQKAHERMGDGLSLILGAWLDLLSGRPEEAKIKAAEASQIDPTGDVLSGAGNILLLTGNPASAEVFIKKAMRITPFHPAWYANRLSEALIMTGKFGEARSVLTELMEKGSDGGVNLREQSRALLSLAVIDRLNGDDAEGKKTIERLRALDPKFSVATVHGYLGMVSDKAFLQSYITTAQEFGLPDVGS